MRTVFVSLAFAVLAGVSQAGTITLSEETFDLPDIAIVRFSGAIPLQLSSQDTLVGNPAPSLTVTTIGTGDAETATMLDGLTYDPSMGGVQSLSFSIDFDAYQVRGQGQFFGLAVEQSGVFYITQARPTDNSPRWRSSLRSGLTTADFAAIRGNGTLDFSHGADALNFGLYVSSSFNSGITAVRYDNFEIVLTTDVAPIPLPASLPLLLLGLGGLALRARRG